MENTARTTANRKRSKTLTYLTKQNMIEATGIE
jgi:hypothetical protein